MIKHIYLFKLKENVSPDEVAEKLMTLKDHVPEIREIEIGKDFKGASNSYDLCEYITFDSMEDYEAFGKNEYHDSIRKYMSKMQEIGVKIDYITAPPHTP